MDFRSNAYNPCNMDTASAGDDDYDDDDFESDVFDQLKEMFSKPYSYRKCTLEPYVCVP